VVEGIGPKIADLLHRDGGIRTWWELHLADVATLRALLASAGPRFQVHDPSSWPEQAGLLARGEWQQFQTFVADLQGGKLGL
jgi:predicted flap endonuclease-1-like 5' DNA nuclease